MKKQWTRFASIFLLAFAASQCGRFEQQTLPPSLPVGSLTPTQISTLSTPPTATVTPGTQEGQPALSGPLVQLAWFSKPPEDSELNFLLEHFDIFILTKTDEPTRDYLREQGANGPFLQYLRLDTIHNPGSCTEQPLHNQVADWVGDFCAISEQHPDWFLLDAAGNRIFSQDSPQFVMMDPGNSGWRAFWLERVRQNQEALDWDGVFVDNVEASLSKRRQWGALPAAYPDDASYRSAIRGFLEHLYTSYFQPEGRLLQANIIALDGGGGWLEYLQFLDGAMDESFAVDWSDDYLSVVQWEDEVRRAEETQALGKHVVLVSQGDRDDADRQTFAFASYLLASYGRASFRYANNEAYREVWLYGNYQLDLGAPLGPRYRDGSVWRRDFTQGSVSVDPVNKTAAIEQPRAISAQPGP